MDIFSYYEDWVVTPAAAGSVQGVEEEEGHIYLRHHE